MLLYAPRINIVTGPSVEPITLAEVWNHLRLTPSGSPLSTPDDAMLNGFIQAARENTEQMCRRPLCQQTWKVSYYRFPRDWVYYLTRETLWSLPNEFDLKPRHLILPGPNLISLTSVQYYDTNNTLQTLDPSLYLVHSDSQPATIELVEGQWWPLTYLREDAVQVTYTAGYAPEGSPPDYRANVPQAIKSAMLIQVQMLYDQIAPADMEKLEKTVDRLLGSYRVYNF